MINRILIRVKVVQILYSYLLSRNEFKIDLPPENPSRDRRFGYAVYLDALNLIQELSGIRTNHPDRRVPAIDVHPALKTNRVGRALADNPVLKDITFKNLADLNNFGTRLQRISDILTSQTVFADYLKKKNRSLEDDVTLWTVLLETAFISNPEVTAILRENPDFSLTGLHYGVMQAVATLKAYNDSLMSYNKAKKELELSLDKAYQLYMSLFVLISEITAEQASRLELAKEKHLATASDLNPNMRFVDNAFVKAFSERIEFTKFVDDNKFTWVDTTGIVDKLLDAILQSDIYLNYMEAPAASWRDDCEFWREIMRSVILPSEEFDSAIEGKSIYWNDDLPTIGTFVNKTIRRFANSDGGKGVGFMPKFKDDEDAQFGARLFCDAVDNREQYREYIDRFISADWDPDRLAFMDIVIMTAAIAEIINFPAIPLPVTFNEYIEIANNYSTRRSGPFINGILYSVAKHLIEQGVIYKRLEKVQ